MDQITPARPNAYTGGSLDRAAHRREDAVWIDTAIAHPDSRFVLFWQGKTLITGMEARAPSALLVPRPDASLNYIFLGLQNEVPLFAADVSGLADPHAALALPEMPFTDMRQITGTLHPDDATILATARAMLHWHAKTKFCSVCGGANTPTRGGYVMQCTQCGTDHFPRTDPAVIMLVAKDDKILLGQSHKFPPERNFYSTLAGFVEPGESLEDAVRREVFEEVGVQVGHVRYHSSQPWPFPASLMLGYYAEALTEEITLETAEMRDARWFKRADIENRAALGFNLPPHDSIARRLIEDWLNR
ncbi:MAG: NADH pyrophosphatase [Acidocella sp. 20-57-95]|nr:MAG: NADH pyrophosphatase [Acidocella sp. 20-57-95]OYV60244.1 MAG: NADH pyrophosphatase [Acidocella sp. 21-58-7]HQT63459.1 NAD(+) diphosphatase [Acidocella sp.]HQU04845.1 NAD(+) diphosphatase [Acidocella sp.]